MNLKQQLAEPSSIFATPLVGVTLLFLIVSFFILNMPFELPTASASTHLGIEGQMAPELNLSHWIDGNGKKTNAIRLNDYRGKVVYLYFFQDW